MQFAFQEICIVSIQEILEKLGLSMVRHPIVFVGTSVLFSFVAVLVCGRLDMENCSPSFWVHRSDPNHAYHD